MITHAHIRVKICGLRTHADIDAAIDAGADAVGFVLAESPRRVTLAQLADLARAVPAPIARTAVFLRPTPTEVTAAAAAAPLDWLQMNAEAATALADTPLAPRLLPVLRDTPDLPAQLACFAHAPTVLIESPRSGRGECADWPRIADLTRNRRIILAGGLTPDNVAEAIRLVRPFAVDVSSGVELAPGRKDPARIRAFIQAVRAVEVHPAEITP